MNTLVNFELAKLLKEKCFNQPCQFLRVGGTYRISNEKEGDLFDNGDPSTQIPNDWFLAPTIAEVVMWLYEKHEVWINVRYMDNVANFGFCVTTLKDNTEQTELYYFSTPTEAYEAAIQYVLNNLI